MIKFANPLLAIDFFPGSATHINLWHRGAGGGSGKGRGGFDTLRVKTTEILKTTILVLKALTNRLYTLKTTTNTRSIAIALTLIFLCFQSPSRPPVRYAQQFTIACLTRLRSSRGEAQSGVAPFEIVSTRDGCSYSPFKRLQVL